MNSITAHCLVKNEENFIGFSVRSVVQIVDKIIIFDTGSTDHTVEIVKKLMQEYPNKIIFEQKGVCTPEEHSRLRQEMVEKTFTSWFMILDGDEIWTNRALLEIVQTIENVPQLECIITPFYLCVGDIYHTSLRGKYSIRGQILHATPRFFKNIEGLHWVGEYNNDVLCDGNGQKIFEKENVTMTQKKFWHVSHLNRSDQGANDFSSGGQRRLKNVPTYFLIGKKIQEQVPEVFDIGWQKKYVLSRKRSFFNFITWSINKMLTSVFKDVLS